MAPNAQAGCLSAHVLPVSLNPSSERTSHLRRNECPKSGGGGGLLSMPAYSNSRPALNCQVRGFTGIWLLSVGNPEIAVHKDLGLQTLPMLWEMSKSEGKYNNLGQLLIKQYRDRDTTISSQSFVQLRILIL